MQVSEYVVLGIRARAREGVGTAEVMGWCSIIFRVVVENGRGRAVRRVTVLGVGRLGRCVCVCGMN
jgi:hypothetical protein